MKLIVCSLLFANSAFLSLEPVLLTFRFRAAKVVQVG